jgi:gas vesicle protein
MGKDASTIRQEIELTRERMGDTVEALGYKADVPSRIKDNVQQRVQAAKGTISDVVDNVKATVGGVSDATVQAGRDRADAVSTTSNKVRDRVGRLNDTVSGGLQNVGDRLQNVGDTVSDRVGSVDVPGSAKRAVNAIQQNPIGLTLTALSIGFLTGSLLPVTEVERKRLEPIRAKIVDQAQAATNDLVEAGKAVAIETAHAAVASALGSAQSHGHEVVDAAKARAAQN